MMLVDVSLEPGDPCRFDYLQLEEGAPRRRRSLLSVTEYSIFLLIGRVSESSAKTPTLVQSLSRKGILSTSGSLSLSLFNPTSELARFRTDFSVTGRGFQLRYSTLCDTEVTGLGGVVESPNFPRLYPHNRYQRMEMEKDTRDYDHSWMR